MLGPQTKARSSSRGDPFFFFLPLHAPHPSHTPLPPDLHSQLIFLSLLFTLPFLFVLFVIVVNRIPMRRVGAETELDGLLILLASSASSFMTGSIVVADGGHLVSNL